MKLSNTLVFVFFVIVISSTTNYAIDWPQWRGPFFNGSADEVNLPESWSWSEDVAWVRSLPGPSSATPVISNSRVFVSSMAGQTNDFVAICLDAETGTQLWQKTVGTNTRNTRRNNAATPSPVTNGKNVFFLYGNGELIGLDFDGKKLWSRNIENDYGTLSVQFGYSSSPLLYDNKLFIQVIRRSRPEADNPLESYVLAVDPATGNTLWKQSRETNAHSESMEAYSTPTPMLHEGKLEILTIGADFITAYDPTNGTELWRYEYWQQKVRDARIVPSLLTYDGIIIGTRYKHRGVFALEHPSSNGEGKILWEFDEAAPDVSTPLLYQDRLYVLDGIRGGRTLTCMDPKTATKFWQGELGGDGPWRASLTAGDGKLYCVNEAGKIVVIKAGGDNFEQLFETNIDETPIHSSIAIADGQLFIRTVEKLYCIKK